MYVTKLGCHVKLRPKIWSCLEFTLDREIFWGEKCKFCLLKADHVVVRFCQFKVVCGECVHANNQISHDGLREVPVGSDPTLSTVELPVK